MTIREYFNEEDKESLYFVLNHLKPSNKFGGGKINFEVLTYSEVKICLSLLSNFEDITSLEQLFKTAFKTDKFFEVSIDEFFSSRNYLLKAFSDLVETEKKLLQSNDLDLLLWKQAGGDNLDAFSNLLPLVQLGEIYGVYPYELQNKPYNQIITLLVCHKRRSEVQSEYNKLKYKV